VNHRTRTVSEPPSDRVGRVSLPRAKPVRVPAIMALEIGSLVGLVLMGHPILGALLGLGLWYVKRKHGE